MSIPLTPLRSTKGEIPRSARNDIGKARNDTVGRERAQGGKGDACLPRPRPTSSAISLRSLASLSSVFWAEAKGTYSPYVILNVA